MVIGPLDHPWLRSTVAPHAIPAAATAACDPEVRAYPLLLDRCPAAGMRPIVDGAVAGERAHDDSKSGLPARQRAGDFEPLPRRGERDARRAREVARIRVVPNGDRNLRRSGRNLGPHVERVLA